MRKAIIIGLLILGNATAALAQNGRFYAAPTTGVEFGRRGEIPSGAVPTAGGMVGLRIGGGWSIEAELDKGFWSTSRSSESFFVSFPPVAFPPVQFPGGPTSHEVFERYGVKGRFDRSEEALLGWSVLASWRTRNPGRVNAAFLGGVSARDYVQRVLRTTTFVSPEIDLADNHWAIQPGRERHVVTAGGFTGGVEILVRATERLTIAPEARITRGFADDDPFTGFRTGLRAMWNF